jgi:transcriptional regulator with XRE-family HTH domain
MDTKTWINEEIGKRVTSAMEQAGINKMQLANATGIARSTLSRSLTGQGPGFRMLELIAIGKALDQDYTDWLPIPHLEATG